MSTQRVWALFHVPLAKGGGRPSATEGFIQVPLSVPSDYSAYSAVSVSY